MSLWFMSSDFTPELKSEEKDEARAKKKKFFSICKRDGCKPILYYTCHGHCPLDRLEQAIGVLPMATEMAMARSAFRRLRRTLLVDAATLLSSLMPVIAAAGPTTVKRKSCQDSSVLRLPLEFSVAYDSNTSKGGELTLWMNGAPVSLYGAERPSTEPLNSAKSRDQP